MPWLLHFVPINSKLNAKFLLLLPLTTLKTSWLGQWAIHGPSHVEVFLMSSTILLLVLISLMCLVGLARGPYSGCCPSWGWKVDVCPCGLLSAPGKAADLSPDSASRARLVNRPCIHQAPNTTTRTRGEHCGAHQMPQIFTPSACRMHIKVLHIYLYHYAPNKALFESSVIIDILQKIENHRCDRHRKMRKVLE